jgi:hypothetical protein
MGLSEIAGTTWAGSAELWLDPMGNEAIRSDCTMSVEGEVVRYTWSHEGKDHQGSITLREHGADFTDTWHQPEPMKCVRVLEGQGLLQVQGRYGPDADWSWRIGLVVRPSGELVLQMTNITSWGEEARAVRMVGTRR